MIALFHSGGLHRAKSRLASHADGFLEAVAAVVNAPRLSPHDAYDLLLTYFMEVTGAGVNLLTEILHTLDNKRFAVMNQNAVSGMALANLRAYPPHPTKQSVDAKCYAEYCQQADTVRKALGLADFTELDALFNYAYWGGGAPTAKKRHSDHGFMRFGIGRPVLSADARRPKLYQWYSAMEGRGVPRLEERELEPSLCGRVNGSAASPGAGQCVPAPPHGWRGCVVGQGMEWRSAQAAVGWHVPLDPPRL